MDIGQISSFILRRLRDLRVLGPQLMQDLDDVGPVVLASKRVEAFALDARVEKGRDVHARVVTNVDVPFWKAWLVSVL